MPRAVHEASAGRRASAKPLADEPDRAVPGAEQHGAERGRGQALPEAEPRGDRGLAPEIEEARGEREAERPRAEGGEVQRGERFGVVEPGGSRRRTGDKDREGEGADQQARAAEVEPADGDREALHHFPCSAYSGAFTVKT
jgi:hypothetical protein